MPGGAASLASPSPASFPALVIFDLDYTLWPLDVDSDVNGPFRRTAHGGVADRRGLACPLYPEVRGVLELIVKGGARIAFASRTTDGDAARALATAHGLWDLLRGNDRLAQLYPSGGTAKTRHFREILKELPGLSHSDILFFDDMPDNIAQAKKDGATAVQLNSAGLTIAAFERGLEEWRRAHA